MSELFDAYQRISGSESFGSSHVSLDRDRSGEEYVSITPNWIDGAGLGFLVALARELELSLALTADGLRLDRHDSGTVRGVENVKRVLRDESER
jgi:hypothetical protein